MIKAQLIPETSWRHERGNIYTIICVTNLASDDLEKFTPTVVYRCTKGEIWSRPISQWYKKFTAL